MPVTAVILTKNEEKNIERCLKSVTFCNEIIVIDDYSTDETIKKIQNLKSEGKNIKVIQRKLEGDFAGQRNFAMKQATNEWILFIDADEEVGKNLKSEILSLKFDKEAYYLKRRDYWWGRELKYGEIKKVRNKGIIRLVKKSSGTWMGNVHEVFYTAESACLLNGFLNHYPHPTVKEFLQDINTYSSLRAQELFSHGNSTYALQIIFFPFLKFILNYFLYLGFLDGPAGFAYAFMMSFHSFLVRAKLYLYKT